MRETGKLRVKSSRHTPCAVRCGMGSRIPGSLVPKLELGNRRKAGPRVNRRIDGCYDGTAAKEVRSCGRGRLWRWSPRACRPLRRRGGRYALSWSARQLLPPDARRWTDRYPEIQVPTLLLWGSHDQVVPRWVGERLQRILPRARLEVLSDCGHMAPEERPEASLERVRAFLQEGDSGS